MATPWLVFGFAATAMALALLLALRAGQRVTPAFVLFPFVYLAFAAVGALILAQRPGNRIGRLALLAGGTGSMVGLVDSYARLSDHVPFLDVAAWLAAWGFPATLAPILLLILLFPTGRLASPRWGIVAALVLVGTITSAAGIALTPYLSDFPDRVNPVGISAINGSILDQGGVGWLVIMIAAVGCGLALVLRLRSATGTERQQLKWVAFAGSLHGLGYLAAFVMAASPDVGQALIFGTLVLVPFAAGVAVLRYRLYEIDVVIRRTLVYGAVVAILGVVYVALVLALQTALAGLTGGGTLPVAVSTLVIAALFGPVRSRVRRVIDRHFYRSQYDAQRTLEEFTTRLRDEVDLEEVGQTLIGVTRRAVKPTSVAIWLREPAP